MAELYFPTGDEKLQYLNTLDPINPWNYNGVQYVWNDEKQVWDIHSNPEVTQDYVDYYDSFRVSRSGDTMGGNLEIKTGLDTSAQSMVHTGFRRTETSFKSFLTFGGTHADVTIPNSGFRSSLTFSGGRKIAEFDPNYVFFYRTFEVDTNKGSDTFLNLRANGEYTLVQCRSTPSQEVISVGVNLATSYKSKFGVCNSSGTPVATFGGTGKVMFRTNSANNFIIRRESDPYNSPEENLTYSDKGMVFRVNSHNFHLLAAAEYNEGLKAGKYTIIKPNGDVVEQNYDDERLLLTWGAFKHHKTKPGSNIIANSEAEAEVGGLWTNGTAIYIKLES